MSNVAIAEINSFASVPPTVDYLQSILSELQALREEVAQLREDNQDLREKITALESQQLQDVDRLALDIAQDRQRISRLEQKPTTAPRGEKTKARIAKIDEILKARGPTTLKELERLLSISPKEMNRIINKLDKRRYELHDRPGDEREKVLGLKAQIR